MSCPIKSSPSLTQKRLIGPIPFISYTCWFVKLLHLPLLCFERSLWNDLFFFFLLWVCQSKVCSLKSFSSVSDMRRWNYLFCICSVCSTVSSNTNFKISTFCWFFFFLFCSKCSGNHGENCFILFYLIAFFFGSFFLFSISHSSDMVCWYALL